MIRAYTHKELFKFSQPPADAIEYRTSSLEYDDRGSMCYRRFYNLPDTEYMKELGWAHRTMEISIVTNPDGSYKQVTKEWRYATINNNAWHTYQKRFRSTRSYS